MSVIISNIERTMRGHEMLSREANREKMSNIKV